MEKYRPLTEEQKQELRSETGMPFNGYIAFFFKGEEIGRTDLIEASFDRHRLRTAEMLRIKEFDDYHLIKPTGEVIAKASGMKMLLVTDVDSDYGTAQGLKYQIFLKRHDGKHCKNCGHELETTQPK